MARFDPNNRSPYRDSADEREVLEFDEQPEPRTGDNREGRSEGSEQERQPPVRDAERDAQRDRNDFPRSRR